MKKVKDPVITANDCQVLIKGNPLTVRMALSNIFDSLKNNEVITQKELHEIVDLSFMSDEEIKKLAEEKQLEMLKSFKEFLGGKNEK